MAKSRDVIACAPKKGSARDVIRCHEDPRSFRRTYDAHAVGVYYDSGRAQWSVFNEDIATMPTNAAFNVLVIKR